MSIYTRTGDTGSTSLFGGKRVLKCHDLVDVYGSLDELNSWIGYISSVINVADVSEFLSTVQSDLFTIGGYLAGWRTVDIGFLTSRATAMEAKIDAFDKELNPLNNFILPGGTELSSRIHIARSICRRVERQIVGLKAKDIPEIKDMPAADFTHIVTYINRFSDLLFTLARFINKQEGVVEVIWSGIDRAAKKK
jgi:cob(I)alamin adenosyltransferase